MTNKLDQAGVEILRYAYDPNSRLTSRWSKAKGNTVYSYDPVGNLTDINYPSSTDVAFDYDALNRVTQMVDAAGTTTYSYTAGGQLWTEDGPWSNDTVTNTYTYRMRTSLALQQPTGGWTNGFWYDYAKRLTNVTSPAGTFSYQLVGQASRLSKLSLPNTSYITNTYDSVARLTGTWLKNSSHTTLNKHEYVLNAGNQRTKHTRTDNSHLTFSYDNIGQLTIVRATNSGGTLLTGETKGYAYDAAWNLSRRTNHSSGSTHTFTVDSKNQLTDGPSGPFTYDPNGNLTNYYSTYMTYAYDDENQLLRWEYVQTAKKEFVYDGLGRLRVRRDYSYNWGGGNWVLDGETRYVYDGMRVIQERNSGNTPTVSYTRGTDLSGSLEGDGGIGGLLGRSHGYSGGNWSAHNYYHADGGGNVTYLVNSSQGLAASYKYDAYGNLVSQSGSLASANVYRYSSKEWLATPGLYYYGYRWYAPNLQRWPNRDPIGELGGLNLYGFVGNGPLDRIDPYGLFAPAPAPLPVLIGGGGGVGGGIAVGGGVLVGGVVVAGVATAGLVGYDLYLMNQINQLNRQNRQAEKCYNQKRKDYEDYKDKCKDIDPPPGQTPCEYARWQLQRKLACKKGREDFTDKYYGGRYDWGHQRYMDILNSEIGALQDWIKQNCP